MNEPGVSLVNGHAESRERTPDRDTLREFIAASHWTFAKTMPHIPHEYTLRRRSPDESMFERFVMLIREYGYTREWKGTPRRYFHLDGWKYWTMGAPLKQTVLINRARTVEGEPA